MNMDDLLILMILGGIGLSGAYLRAEFVLCRGRRSAERRNAATQREIRGNRSCPDENAVISPATERLHEIA
jgi:hypothetical protein